MPPPNKFTFALNTNDVVSLSFFPINPTFLHLRVEIEIEKGQRATTRITHQERLIFTPSQQPKLTFPLCEMPNPN